MANICRGLRKFFFFVSSPQVTYPYRIYWCKKNGSKISHLGTFKGLFLSVDGLIRADCCLLISAYLSRTQRSLNKYLYSNFCYNFQDFFHSWYVTVVRNICLIPGWIGIKQKYWICLGSLPLPISCLAGKRSFILKLNSYYFLVRLAPYLIIVKFQLKYGLIFYFLVSRLKLGSVSWSLVMWLESLARPGSRPSLTSKLILSSLTQKLFLSSRNHDPGCSMNIVHPGSGSWSRVKKIRKFTFWKTRDGRLLFGLQGCLSGFDVLLNVQEKIYRYKF